MSPGNIMRYIILFSSEALFNTVHLATPLQVMFHCESAGIEMVNYCCHELYQILFLGQVLLRMVAETILTYSVTFVGDIWY